MHNTAFIVGKFLPPHLGHLSLIKAGQSLCNNVVVAVEQQPNEPLPASLRARLMQQDLPQGVVVKPLLKNMPPNPVAFGDSEKFWKIWQNEIHNLCPIVDVLLSSDDYGAQLAHDQKAQWVKVDRTGFPLSATWLKEDFWKRQDFLMPSTRAFFTKRVAFIGGESTGKSTLSQKLAHHFDTRFVPELAQQIITAKNLNPNNLTYEDLVSFSLSQKATRMGLLPLASRILFEDSNELTTAMFARFFGFEELAQNLENEFLKNMPHHIILCLKEGSVFRKATHRLNQEKNAVDFVEQQTLRFLQKHNVPFSCVKGSWDARTQQAFEVVEKLKNQWENLDFPSHCQQAQNCNLFVVASNHQEKSPSPPTGFKV